MAIEERQYTLHATGILIKNVNGKSISADTLNTDGTLK
jgi:hypothetical protein